MDAQGPDRVRHYAQEASATYPVLVDEEGSLSALYDFLAIPNGWIIGRDGIIRLRHVSGFDIRKPETAGAIEQILQGEALSGVLEGASRAPREAALRVFQEGTRLLHEGRTREAVEAWLRAAEADPENLVVRKQIWHLFYPELFEPVIDYAWQRTQLEREARLGMRKANPIDDLP